MTTTIAPHERVLLSASQTETAGQVLDDITAETAELRVHATNTADKAVPSEMVSLMRHVLEVVSRGGSITIGTLPEELTTSAAAQQLGVSRQALMKMIHSGRIPAHKVGTHHRLFAKDVIREREARQSRERASALELLDMGED